MTNLKALTAANATRWQNAKVTDIYTTVSRRLIAGKDRYQAVANRTGVPWFIIAVIHQREASQNWNTQLGQGDPLNKVSVHVPRGRGPFKSWEDGAYDALVNCAPYAARWKDWSPGGAMTLLEQYNGLGYAGKGLPSPYVWAGTNQYQKGKYIADGQFDPNYVDKQPGCVAMLKTMMALDPTISFVPVTITEPEPKPTSPSSPSITNPSKGSIGAFIVNLLTAIFRRK